MLDEVSHVLIRFKSRLLHSQSKKSQHPPSMHIHINIIYSFTQLDSRIFIHHPKRYIIALCQATFIFVFFSYHKQYFKIPRREALFFIRMSSYWIGVSIWGVEISYHTSGLYILDWVSILYHFRGALRGSFHSTGLMPHDSKTWFFNTWTHWLMLLMAKHGSSRRSTVYLLNNISR